MPPTVLTFIMATPSGAPPAPTSTAPTSTSPDKKKLFIALGVAGVAALGVGGYFLTQGGGTAVPDATDNTAVVDPNVPVDGEPPPGEPGTTLTDGGIPPANGMQISTANNPSTLLPLSPYRRDPFAPFLLFPPPPTPAPPPLPTPTPPPPPPRPVEIPLPDAVDVPGLGGSGVFGGGTEPGFAVPGASGSSAIDRPLILPKVVIPRLNSTKIAPTNAFPPPRSSSGAGSGEATPSYNKRLSGVVIGNGVRAVLEISGGLTPKSYVVQPGDVVEGITILNIRRYNEGGTQVTRMLIRENGGERTVDLKPGPPRTAPGGELGGPEGFGGPGGFGQQGFGP